MESDWIAGLIGGLMIGGAAAIYLLGNARIMGASGIISGLLDVAATPAWAERAIFAAALIATPAILVRLGIGDASPAIAGTGVMILAGLLVGFGTRLGNGCTSGHGVCGISRMSRRGIVATLTYLLTGGIAVIVARMLGWS